MRSLTHSSAGSTALPIPANYPPPSAGFLPTAHPPQSAGSQLAMDIQCPQLPSWPSGPHSFFDINNNSLLFSEQTKDHVIRAIHGSLADSTLKHYSGTIKQFIRFCDEERIPEHLRFPADEFVLCAFTASSLGKHAGGTPRSRLLALKAWHVMHNMEWRGSP